MKAARRGTMLAVALVFFIASLSPMFAPGQAFGGQGSASAPMAKATDPAKLAKKLAKGVSGRSSSARYKGIIEIMKALHIGVYTAAGEAVVSGAERGPSDFYLYDFEISALASALGRKLTWSLQDLVKHISALLIEAGGEAVAPDPVQAALATAAQKAAQNPADPFSLLYLLIRELGLLQKPSYDLSANVSADQIKFSALQYLLILSDTLVPLAPGAAQPGAFPDSESSPFDGGPPIAGGGNPCEFLGEGDVKLLKDLALILEIPAPTPNNPDGKVGDFLHLVAFPLDAIHGWDVGLGIDVQETKAYRGKHHAHDGPKEAGHVSTYRDPGPGGQVVFQIGVQNLIEHSENTVKCGELLGFTFPPLGPVPDIPVHWDKAALADYYGLLKTLGTIVHEDSKTGPDGIATLIWQPSDEPADTKPVRSSKDHMQTLIGWLTPTASIISAFGNHTARLSERLTPRIVFIPWDLEWHKAAGDYTGTIDFTMSGTFSFTAKLDVSFTLVPGVQGGNYYDMTGTVTLTSDITYGTLVCTASSKSFPVDTGAGTTELQMYDNPPNTYDLHFLTTPKTTLDCLDHSSDPPRKVTIPDFPVPVAFGGGHGCQDGPYFVVSDIDLLDSAYTSPCTQSKAVWRLEKQ